MTDSIKNIINLFSEVSLEHPPCYEVIKVDSEVEGMNSIGVWYIADFEGEWRLAYGILRMDNVKYADIGELKDV